jgi:hypothetical protein
MAKVYGINPIELREGVKDEDFESFWLNEYAPQGKALGWTSHLLKGDRGLRIGEYVVIWEKPSVESRDRIVAADGSLTEEGQRLLGTHFAKMNEKLNTFVTGWPHTDYIELGG